MPFGARDVLLVIRARDVASRTIATIGDNFGLLDKKVTAFGHNAFQVGAALTAVGAGLGAVGAVGVNFFNSATNAAIDYSKAAALTTTQTQGLGASVEDIAQIGIRVAKQIPAPFNEMQDALFDIFSSLDIGTKDAEMLLKLFAKGAVAGQTDIRTAARSTIAVMNAYGKPFSEANQIMDVMFSMVKFGVGTFEEFNTSIGRAIPAATAAGQEFETLAGVMVLLTRNGLSTEMAATSAARAMELFTKPDVTQALTDLGVSVVDAQGNFRQLDEILRDLGDSQGWAKLGDPERKKLFEEIFGTGTIQARRFFDVAIPGFATFGDYVDRTNASSGALSSAYGIMFDEPALKAQLLKNRMEILRVEIGDRLIPAKLALMEAANKLLKWWDGLSEGTKDLIVKVGALSAVIATISGVILVATGLFLMFATAVGSIGGAALLISGVVVAVAAIIAIGILLVKNWDTIKEMASTVWQSVQDAVQMVWQKMQQFWDWLSTNAVAIWQQLGDTVSSVWQMISSAVDTAVGVVMGALETLWGWLYTAYAWFADNFGAGFARIWDAISEAITGFADEVGPTISGTIDIIQYLGRIAEHVASVFIAHWRLMAELSIAIVKPAFEIIADTVGMVFRFVVIEARFFWETIKLVFGLVAEYIRATFRIVAAIVRTAVGIIQALWENFGGFILDRVKATWDLVSSLIAAAITGISNVIQLVMNIIQGDWGEAWDNVKNIFSAFWDALFAIARFFVISLKDFLIDLPMAMVGFLLDAIPLMLQLGKDVFNALWDGLKAVVPMIFDWLITDVKDFILSAFDNAIDWLFEAGKDIINGLINGFKDVIQAVWDFIQSIFDDVVGFFKDLFGIGSPSTVMMEIGKDIILGLWEGIKAIWEREVHFWTDLYNFVIDFFADAINWLFNAGKNILQGFWNGLQNIWNNVIWPGITGIPGAIIGVFSGALEWLVQKGKDIIQGMWNGITGKIEDVKNWFLELPGKILDWLGFSSPPDWAVDAGHLIVEGLLKGLGGNIGKLWTWLKNQGVSLGDLLGGIIPDIGADISGFIGLGETLARGFGWTGGQWAALRDLWGGESGWNPSARNPSSGAYGIPQALPASKMGPLAQASNPDLMSRAAAQINWGLGYIKNRYGDPINAWQTWLSRVPHWYEQGAWEILANELAYLHKGEMVVPAGPAETIRRGRYGDRMGQEAPPTQRGIFIENAYFGDKDVVRDLDWWTKTQGAGV